MKVFISYASEDRETAEKLYNDLENAGMTPWMDEKDIIAGQRRKTEIRRAIENSDCFIALFSSNSVTAKGKIHRELKLAIDILEELPPRDIFIIPAKLDDCHHVYEELEDIQWADLSSYEYGLNRILGALSLSDTEEAGRLLINKDKLKKLVSDTNQSRRPRIFSKPAIVFLFALIVFTAGIAGISFLLYLHNNKGSRFVIENPFLRSDDSVIIRAANDKANYNRPLDIKFQGILFSEKGIPSDKVSKNGISWQTWLFTFKDCNPPEKYLKNGNYEIRISFAGEDDFENNAYKIVFDSEPLNVEIRSIKNENDPARRTFKGVAGKKSMSPENEVTVDIFYYHEGKHEKVNIPVKRIEDIDKGITYFEFETAIYSPVRIDPDDSRYNEVFFGFEVRDKTGQKFSRKQSYANYMSEGNEIFSLNDIGDLRVAKNIEEKDRKIITTYRYIPDQKRIYRLPNGEYPIRLHVTQELKNERRLEWETNARDVKPGTIIFRDGEKLAQVNGTDYYIDKKPLDKDKTDYHIEKKGKDGTILVSNTESYTRAEIEKTFTNSLKMKFVYIKAGTFMMGSPESEKGRDDDEKQHQVTLTKDFYMQTTEVTQGQWKEVMGNNPSYFRNCGDDCPVENVSWNDVQDFIKKLNKKGEGVYRLPTEAEWEYAARAGSRTAFANGDITNKKCNDPNLDKVGWYCGNAGRKTHPVAKKQRNAWGLYDMHGNVWEWCRDKFGSYPSSAVTDPVNTKGSDRVNRGGSWVFNAGYCRSASRHHYSPGPRYHPLGFRLSRGLHL